MTLEQAIEFLKNVYGWAVKQKHIINPLAYALYKTWQEADKKRKIKQ